MNTPEGCASIQRDLDSLERWVVRNLMGFNTDECRVQHLGRKNNTYLSGLGAGLLEKSYLEKNLGVLMDDSGREQAA